MLSFSVGLTAVETPEIFLSVIRTRVERFDSSEVNNSFFDLAVVIARGAFLAFADHVPKAKIDI